jgi:hypothetical protein
MRSIGTMSRVRRFVRSYEFGQPFCTQELLKLGSTSAVNQALSKLVKKGELKRLARGCFMRQDVGTELPSLSTIAEAKTRAFGRKFLTDGSVVLNEFDDPFQIQLHGKRENHFNENGEIVFATDGRNTSFVVLGTRIYLKQRSPGKLLDDDAPHALVIRALCSLPAQLVTPNVVRELVSTLGRSEREQLKNSSNKLPARIADILVPMFEPKLRKTKKSSPAIVKAQTEECTGEAGYHQKKIIGDSTG